jgi:aminomethyltransferase
MAIKDSTGREIGVVTSGTFSPSLKVGIALALIEPNFTIGDDVTIDVRGRESSATITALPFVPSHVR